MAERMILVREIGMTRVPVIVGLKAELQIGTVDSCQVFLGFHSATSRVTRVGSFAVVYGIS